MDQIGHSFWKPLPLHLIILLSDYLFGGSQEIYRRDKQQNLYSFAILCEETPDIDLLCNCGIKKAHAFFSAPHFERT